MMLKHTHSWCAGALGRVRNSAPSVIFQRDNYSKIQISLKFKDVQTDSYDTVISLNTLHSKNKSIQMFNIVLLSLLFVLNLVHCVPQVALYAQANAIGGSPVELGTIAFNETSGLASIINIPKDLSLPNGKYCVGVANSGQFQCHSYALVS